MGIGISKASNRWLNRTYKCIAILLVTFAVLISTLRLLLPYAHNYRTDLQDYINQTYGSNIIIGALDMGWQSSGPTLVASNVSLLQSDEAEVYVQAFDLNIDFWQSLQHRRLITRDFSLNGVKILVNNAMVSETSVSSDDTSMLTNLMEMFFSQIGRFSLNNSQIVYQTKRGKRTLLIDSLHWFNQGNNHRARGNVIVDGITSNNLQINLDVKGQHIEDMHGTLYLEANQLNITPWLGKVLAIADENTHSSVNFNAWLSINKGQLDKLLLDLGQNQIAWQHQQKINTLDINSGQLVIDNLAKPSQLHLYSSAIEVISNKQQWQPLIVELKRDQQRISTYVSALDVSGAAGLLPLLVKDDSTQRLMAQLAPAGTIENIYLQQDEQSLSAVANFSEIKTNYSQGIPGVTSLNGELIYQPGTLHLDVNAADGALDFAQHFSAPINYQTFSSAIDVQFDQQSWRLTANDLKFNSEQLRLNAELAVTAEPDKALELSLLATASDANVIYAPSFYPNALMGEDLVNYLNRALEKGRLAQAVVMINGPIADFPFTQGNGTFVVDAELTNSTFKFDSQWPAVEHFSANLNFTNNSMLITGRDGTLAGIDVKGVQAEIADLSDEQVLSIGAQFKQTAPALIANLMMSSPLSDTVGEVLEKVVITHPVSGEFQLNLPLNDVEAAVAQGNVYFDNNQIALQPLQMQFTKINGELAFVNDKITTKDLSLLWRDMPMSLQVSAAKQTPDYQTDIQMTANWQEPLWRQQLPEKLTDYGRGELEWTGLLTLNNTTDGQFSYQLVIDSELTKLQLDLPEPYQKASGDNLLATIKVSGNEDQSTIDAKIGQQLNFYGNLNHQQVAFSQAHLILGDEQMYLPMNGFHITTNLARANFFQWQPLITDILDSVVANDNEDSDVALLEQPQRVRGNIEQLDFWDESIHGVSFNLEDQVSWWQLALTSKEARAEMKFYPDWYQQGLELNADFIRLSPDKQLFNRSEQVENSASKDLATVAKSEKNESATIDAELNQQLFSQMPPMRVHCQDCRYGNLDLGEVSFALERSQPDLLKLYNFVAKRKDNKLSFDLSWQLNEQQSSTQLIGELSSKDIERELERLAIPSTVKDSGLKSRFDLKWLGGPHDFALAHLNGDLSGSLDEGYLAEVPDQARAFSILSLQSLVRKLKFDFRDIFSDGMFYSEVKGDFHLKDGVIYTKNTFLKGNAGDLSVKGNTDLNSETLDYRMSYKPNVTSSLPAIAWIATLNPVTFLAGIAIDEVITSKVVSEYKFEVTGSISEPNFKEVDRKTQNISVGRDSPPQIVENLPEEKAVESENTILDPETGLIKQKPTLPVETLPLDKKDG
ncbi:DUF3971 domain-containing protein [Thalassotalea insulae]|uniref:DUF3971 domain-containing protein n=1 Tax=Thalassotalea insulae TaxID=2056778 RepID=A0ABQ6GPE7_9GAMM|nr:YhdP family protein [Thalassotalea insulae]GLX77853.1 DUF3971 domain-containing protein [Thalassotalea insulae]